jgi:hypothetical protein
VCVVSMTDGIIRYLEQCLINVLAIHVEMVFVGIYVHSRVCHSPARASFRA